MNKFIQLINLEEARIERSGRVILKNIDLSVHDAEIVFIVGDSGSGKSSLLKSLYGALKISGKETNVLGFNLEELNVKSIQQLRKKLGLVFQDFKIFNKLSVYENLNYFLKAIGFKNEESKHKVINDILAKVDLINYSSKKAFELSGGEKQRLSIARALIHKPKLILADEPTGNLNQSLGIEIFKLLRNLALEQGSSIITATHDETLASEFSSKFYRCFDQKLMRV